MTLEASFIIPLVIMLYILIIYCSFFLYNQCIISQGCYIAALRGSQYRNVSNEKIKMLVEMEIEELMNQQIFYSNTNYKVEVNSFSIRVEANSNIPLLMRELQIYKIKTFTIIGYSEIKRIEPVNLIRKFRKLT